MSAMLIFGGDFFCLFLFFFGGEGDLSNETDEIRGWTRRLAKYMGYVFFVSVLPI